MNVVFWNPMGGHGATTSNLTCVAIMASLIYNYKTISFQSGYSYNNLDQAFLGVETLPQVNTVSEEFAYYMEGGIDGVLGSFNRNTFTHHKFLDYASEVIKELVYYLPSSSKHYGEFFEDRFHSHILSLLRESNKIFHLTFIDNQRKKDKVTMNLIFNADICVINISQNPREIAKVFEELYSINHKCRIFFLIGRYEERSKYTLKYISREFSIKEEDIGIIPYCPEALDAFLSGKTGEFLKSNLNCKKKSRNYTFVYEVKSVVKKLFDGMDVTIGKR